MLVQWAQTNLSAHWGLQGKGKPLGRKVNPVSRSIMCGSSFVEAPAITAALQPYADADSCDEFPFAGTYENPANTGQISIGSQCAQLTAVQVANAGTNEAADWPMVKPPGNPTGKELFARGHIPLNKSVGGKFGKFILGQRLVDHDPFWLSVDR